MLCFDTSPNKFAQVDHVWQREVRSFSDILRWLLNQGFVLGSTALSYSQGIWRSFSPLVGTRCFWVSNDAGFWAFQCGKQLTKPRRGPANSFTRPPVRRSKVCGREPCVPRSVFGFFPANLQISLPLKHVFH